MKDKIEYNEYLKLDQLLGCHSLRSDEAGRPAHDEMLFITVHHSNEIWFKQLLFELNSVVKIFSQSKVEEREMGQLVARLQRMVEILKALVSQVDILETMTPLDFLEFRDLLYPASGFQSYQFRLLENRLGLKADKRLTYNNLPYYSQLQPHQAKLVQDAEKAPSLFESLQSWLERTPFLQTTDFDFWASYKTAVTDSFNFEAKMLDDNKFLSAAEKEVHKNVMLRMQDSFKSLFDESEFDKQRTSGEWRLSHKAALAALLIQLYRDEPVFQLPFRLLTSVLDLDATLTQWRYRHALMAQRMLGRRVGTGGSSGSEYLKQATEQHRVFTDFYRLTTFFIPRSKLPQLPEAMKRRLDFAYNN
jgi:tryptophan 2,3-dioxygenase